MTALTADPVVAAIEEARSDRALVASAAYSTDVELRTSVDGHPTAVAVGQLSTLLATGAFNEVARFAPRTETPWWAFTEFVVKAVGPLKFHLRGSSLFTSNNDIAISGSYSPFREEYDIYVAGNEPAKINAFLAMLAKLLPAPTPPPPVVRPYNMVPVTFWMQDKHYGGARARYRDINVTEFEDVAANYPEALRPKLSKLMTSGAPDGDGSGKLVLFQGPPGTGKTRSILTLMSMWRNWCASSLITDPDAFFSDSEYMNDVVFGASGMKDWLLLIVEDGDEYLNVEGRESKGQSIARLLNLCDGIVGQGLNLITLISTNVDVKQLNPAMVRPGRCLANLHFGAFTPEESAAWLAANGHEGDIPFEGWAENGMTLAQLYATIRPSDGPEVLA